ncbi:MAG: serine hydrolase [Chthonomonas sp.]|nr:serine hydrolase [Chthonomonas sp.]
MKAALLAILLLSAAIAPAQDLAPLQAKLNKICKGFQGRMGYSLKVLKTGKQISFNGDERFPSASTIKTGVALAALQMVDEGKMKMSDKRALPPPAGRESSMWSFFFRDGLKLDLDGWVNLMVTVSDNTATMVVRDWLGTMEVNRRLAALGLANTKILGNAPKEEVMIQRLRRQFGMGMTTPNEMNRLLELIYQRKAGSPAVCEKMVRILSHQYWDDWIGGSVPPGVTCASKSGAISRSRSDTAIVFSPTNPYILTIYTDSQKDRRWASDNEGDASLKKMAGMIWNHLHPNSPYTMPAGYDKFYPTGGGVEDS